MQSDKASVEITSRFSGVVKKLYYDAGEMAKVGKPFVDIDIEGDVDQETLENLTPAPSPDESVDQKPLAPEAPQKPETVPSSTGVADPPAPKPKGKHAALATPAVRHMCKELKIDILDVDGTGRDGRVLKEDIQKFIEARKNGAAISSSPPPPNAAGVTPPPAPAGVQTETRMPLTKTQEQMFKTMTRSLSIPHFLYADEIDFTELAALRTRLNKVLSTSASSPAPVVPDAQGVKKLSYLPLIVKAVSVALSQYPILNARVDVSADPAAKPALVHRSQHNIGVAMDTPSGLLVPVIKNVQAHSILTIAAELSRLQALAVAGRLGPQDMAGGTITVSNIGSIGGTYCSPVIVDGQVAILGVGRMRDVPDVVPSAAEASGWAVRGVRKVCNFSWSADHRVVDGATMARAAEVVRALVEEPDVMVMHLR